jgi:hypothetical protein
LKQRKKKKNWCPPIPVDGPTPCTVEFAETPGGIFYHWRTSYEGGRVFHGICGEEGNPTFIETDPGFDVADARIEDRKAVKAAWPVWEKILDQRYAEASEGLTCTKPVIPFRPVGYRPFTGDQEIMGPLDDTEEARQPPAAEA